MMISFAICALLVCLGAPSCAQRRIYVYLVVLTWSTSAFCGAIHDAAKNGRLENLKVLLAENPDLVSSKDSDGWTPLHWAAREGNNDIAEFVLTNKADVNAQNDEGWTPLHVAILMGQKDIQQLLLQHGGQDLMPQAIAPRDTNIATAEAVLDTAIHDAASEGNLACVKELLSE
jgi:serine/threonine-protein phosphatase 6 regulatory ankyrin repeat subunit B